MKAGIVQRIFQDHYPAYRRGRRLSWRQRWAAHNIRTCRTAAQGFHEVQCPSGDYRAVRYNSCKHRACPLCGAQETDAWVRTQQQRALPCGYYHIIFTLPDTLHGLWAYNRQGFTNLLFHAAWHSLHELLNDAKWLGALPGAIAVFQSWGETLNTHPHLHFIVTAGGLNDEGQWIAAAQTFLLPAAVLRAKFQGKFLAYLREALEQDELVLPPDHRRQTLLNLFNKLGRCKWNVRIEPPYSHPRALILYLARYLRRGPIAESRIAAYQDGQLTIWHKRRDRRPPQSFRLSADEFIHRLLLHVPPKGLRVVRAYGLFHHRRAAQLAQARAQLSGAATVCAQRRPPPPAGFDGDRGTVGRERRLLVGAPRCPRCQALLAVTLRYYPPRAGPERMAA